MFKNNKPVKHKKGDYRDIAMESMNSLDELEGLTMNNTYVSPYEKRNFEQAVEILDRDPRFTRNSVIKKPSSTEIPKQTEDAFASMMKKTVKLNAELQKNDSPTSKEDSFKNLMKKKLNNYENQKESTNLSTNLLNKTQLEQQPINLEKKSSLIEDAVKIENNISEKTNVQEKKISTGIGLLNSFDKPKAENINKNDIEDDLDIAFEYIVKNGEEWKNYDEIYKIANIPKLKNGMSIETIMGMSSEMSNMPIDVKMSSILSYLEEKGIEPSTIIEDYRKKDKIINLYEEFLEERLSKKKLRIESEINLLNKKIAEREDIIKKDMSQFNDWKNDKMILEDMMKEACECLGHKQ